MNRINKINHLDFAPRIISTTPIPLSKIDKKSINAIQKKYGYKGCLATTISSLPNLKNTFNDFYRQEGRPKSKKILFTKTIKAAETLKECIKSLPAKTRMRLRPDELQNLPYAAYETIPPDLIRLIEICKLELAELPKDAGGKTKGSLSKELIWILILHYEHSTKMAATCGFDDTKQKYVGKFYDFLLEIKPILSNINIRLGTDSTIGQYTRELLTNRNKRNKII